MMMSVEADLYERDLSPDTSLVSHNASLVDLLFSKSAVYIHASPRKRDNIAGYISLSSKTTTTSKGNNRESQVLLSWIPATFLGDELDMYTLVEKDGSANIRVKPPPSESSSYAFSIPLSEIGNLVVKPPRTGWSWGSVVVISTSGTAFPALFFHDDECPSTLAEQKRRRGSMDPFGESGNVYWGFDSLLSVLQSLTHVSKSETSPWTFILHPSLPPSQTQDFINSTRKEVGPNLKWKILERFSRITRLGRSTADSILESDAAKEVLARLPPQIRAMVASQQAQTLAREYDSARLYLARWASQISDASHLPPPSSTLDGSAIEEETALGMFELISITEGSRREKLTEREWSSFFNAHGELTKSESEIKDILFHGSCEESITGQIWAFLLGVYPWTSSTDSRTTILSQKRREYNAFKKQWFDTLSHPSDEFIDERHRIEKDIHRTDRQHPFFKDEDLASPDPTAEWGTNGHMELLKDILMTYNVLDPELGYVQGMSDLLAPVYVVSGDDGLAFWIFAGLMGRLSRNFARDGSGMRLQLVQLAELTRFMAPSIYAHLERCESLNFFFFFRMLLIIYKREFPFATILDLWTILFTDHLGPQFQIFVALAILDLNAGPLGKLGAFDEILKYVNELSGRMDLELVLVRAEILCVKFKAMVRVVEEKSKDGEGISENLMALIN